MGSPRRVPTAGDGPRFGECTDAVVDRAGHDLAEADDDRIGAFAEALITGMEPRELPPVLVAIEEMTADPSTTLDSRS